eukprot:Skav206038  [mRNA]  locus=scaffold1314:483264:483923:- [translate_table: standard]
MVLQRFNCCYRKFSTCFKHNEFNTDSTQLIKSAGSTWNDLALLHVLRHSVLHGIQGNNEHVPWHSRN